MCMYVCNGEHEENYCNKGCVYPRHPLLITLQLLLLKLMLIHNTQKKTPSPGKFQRSRNIGLKSAEFFEGSDSVVTLTYSLTQKDSICSSLHLRGSKLQKPRF